MTLSKAAAARESRALQKAKIYLRKHLMGSVTGDRFVAYSVALSCVEIRIDMLNGEFSAADIKCFADLHDYVDANTYGGLCDEDVNALGEKLFPSHDKRITALNEIQSKVNTWIVDGGLER